MTDYRFFRDIHIARKITTSLIRTEVNDEQGTPTIISFSEGTVEQDKYFTGNVSNLILYFSSVWLFVKINLVTCTCMCIRVTDLPTLCTSNLFV